MILKWMFTSLPQTYNRAGAREDNMVMKRQIMLALCLLLSIFISAHENENISGTYTNAAGMEIKIQDSTFIYIIPQNHLPVYANDTLAKCIYNRINDQFIEINSIENYSSILRSMRIIQSKRNNSNDSITIKFVIPYIKSNLEIEVFTNCCKSYKLDYSQEKQEISIPRTSSGISFSICPEYLVELNFEGQYAGRIRFNSIEYTIDNNNNYTEIKIPAIKDSFFDSFYMKGEYVRILQDSLTWKGDTFLKKKLKP